MSLSWKPWAGAALLAWAAYLQASCCSLLADYVPTYVLQCRSLFGTPLMSEMPCHRRRHRHRRRCRCSHLPILLLLLLQWDMMRLRNDPRFKQAFPDQATDAAAEEDEDELDREWRRRRQAAADAAAAAAASAEAPTLTVRLNRGGDQREG